MQTILTLLLIAGLGEAVCKADVPEVPQTEPPGQPSPRALTRAERNQQRAEERRAEARGEVIRRKITRGEQIRGGPRVDNDVFFSEQNVAERTRSLMPAIPSYCQNYQADWTRGFTETMTGKKIADVIMPCCEEKQEETSCSGIADSAAKQCCVEAAYRGLGALARAARDVMPYYCTGNFNAGVATGARACVRPRSCLPESDRQVRWSFCRNEETPRDLMTRSRRDFDDSMGVKYNGCRQAGFVSSYCNCIPEITNLRQASGGTGNTNEEMIRLCNAFDGRSGAATQPKPQVATTAETDRAIPAQPESVSSGSSERGAIGAGPSQGSGQ